MAASSCARGLGRVWRALFGVVIAAARSLCRAPPPPPRPVITLPCVELPLQQQPLSMSIIIAAQKQAIAVAAAGNSAMADPRSPGVWSPGPSANGVPPLLGIGGDVSNNFASSSLIGFRSASMIVSLSATNDPDSIYADFGLSLSARSATSANNTPRRRVNAPHLRGARASFALVGLPPQ